MIRRLLLAGLVLSLLVEVSYGINLTLPPNAKGEAGDFITVKATTDGKEVRWVALDNGLRVFPVQLLKDSKTAVVTGTTPGDYRLLAYTADKDGTLSDPAYTVVTITGVPIPPNPPAPPMPPVPPSPVPTDPLTTTFQIAYSLDLDADRAKSLAFLQSAYKGMAAQAGGRKDLTTNLAFVTWMKSIIEMPGVGLSATQVRSLRSAIGTELSTAWGTTIAPTSPDIAASELLKIYNALSGVK